MLETILYYATMWGPAIVSILGIAATVIVAIGKVIKAIGDWQIAKEDETAISNKLHADMKQAHADYNRLMRYNQKLLEELSRIKGYDITMEDD